VPPDVLGWVGVGPVGVGLVDAVGLVGPAVPVLLVVTWIVSRSVAR
jgi:hypothetical protein